MFVCRLQFIRNFCFNFYYYCWCFHPPFSLFCVINVIIRFGPLSIIVHIKEHFSFAYIFICMMDRFGPFFWWQMLSIVSFYSELSPRILIYHIHTFHTRNFMLQWILLLFFIYSAYQQQQQQRSWANHKKKQQCCWSNWMNEI